MEQLSVPAKGNIYFSKELNMSEIKSKYTPEQVKSWMEEKNLTVANQCQLWAYLMEMEERVTTLEKNQMSSLYNK